METSGFAAGRGSLIWSDIQESPTPRVLVRNSSDLGSKEREKVNGTTRLRLLQDWGKPEACQKLDTEN